MDKTKLRLHTLMRSYINEGDLNNRLFYEVYPDTITKSYDLMLKTLKYSLRKHHGE